MKKKNRGEKKMGEEEKKETQQERERKKKKMAPLLCFRFPSGTGTPSNRKQASRQAGRQKILKQSGVVGTFPLPLRFPLKFANTRVKCEFIRRSLTARGFSSTARTRFNAVNRLRHPRNGKTGFPSLWKRRGTTACRERD